MYFRHARIEAKDIDHYTPLLTAAEFGRTECFKALLDHGACIEVQNKDGKNVAFLAAESNHPDIMKVGIKGDNAIGTCPLCIVCVQVLIAYLSRFKNMS